ncbi:MAG TPA: hypothetical protein DGD08_04815 [Gemmatimonas aurantiaca]|uniref:Integral membrane protein n=2 Tax=Gemmatimonas aurantiaca TaxID=173480 RepID=A0A3D4V793_9BACT|nr:Pr6Pr family membrane protein [Gemmatimonas aurantiaca]BAH40456.1 hypothetical membrane protein [Gemmatimonas aurantiaca T-27]HCT56518.1 hypothetical protein [Gemmatimonas aurantiaca]
MLSHPAGIAARLGLGVLTWTAIVIQFTRHFDAGFPLLNFFSYFTILANGIAGSVLLIAAYFGVRQQAVSVWYDRARGAATLYMAVVGLVFVTLLRNVDLGGLLPWINTVHHYLMPVVMVMDWLLTPPTRSPTSRDLLVFFSFPLAYVVYTLLRGAQIGWYPYPFFNPALVGGYGTVMLYVLGMLITFVLVGWALRWTAMRANRPASPVA